MNTEQMQTRRRFLNGILVAVGVVTIGVGLYFAAIDQPLLTTAVCFSGLLPVALLLFALSKVTPAVSEAQRLLRQRNNALTIGAAGLIATAAGGLLLLSPLHALAMILLGVGPGLLLGGLAAYGLTRRERAQADSDAGRRAV